MSLPPSRPSFPLSQELEDLSDESILQMVPKESWCGITCPSLEGIRLLGRLGRGGMGAVYYGYHERLDREVAVKILPFQIADSEGMVERFIREARVAARIQSPHLVSVLDVNRAHGVFYLVMEYVNGASLGAILKDYREQGTMGLDLQVVFEVMEAACKGLIAAHDEGVVHRDLKPDNILIGRDRDGSLDTESARIADLGLARSEMEQTITMSNAAMGTPGYMAPEQGRDARSVGAPADIFGMGATMYALLTGRAPFSGSSPVETILNTMQNDPIALTTLRPDVPTQVEALVNRCLDKNPAARYGGAKQLADAIRACRESVGSGIMAAPPLVVPQRPIPALGSDDHSTPEPTVRVSSEGDEPNESASQICMPNTFDLICTGVMLIVLIDQITAAGFARITHFPNQVLHSIGHFVGVVASIGSPILFYVCGQFVPILLICGLLWLFWRARWLMGFGVGVAWMGSFLNFMATYMADAPRQTLHEKVEFLGHADGVVHDWSHMLSEFGISLKQGAILAKALAGCSHLVVVGAIAIGVCVILRSMRGGSEA